MYEVAIVGAGRMGTDYARICKELLAVRGIGPDKIIMIDTDPAKLAAAKTKDVFRGVTLVEKLEPGTAVKAAIVATNTPSHHPVLIDLMQNHSIKQFLCEKPLGLNVDAVNQVRDAMRATDSTIYTALLMTFSPAILRLIKKMQAEGLVLIEGYGTWSKNRFGDKRPTPGDLEDEAVHELGIFHSLCAVNQTILGIRVAGQLTYPKYVNPEAQAKAHEFDPSFPTRVNASTMVTEYVATDNGEVMGNFTSSFIGGKQVRCVWGVLASKDDPSLPLYAFEFNFDTKKDGKTVDTLELTELDGNTVYPAEDFACDKLADQTAAFLTAVSDGIIDERLTDYAGARMATVISAAILESHEAGMKVVHGYTDADIEPLRKTA